MKSGAVTRLLARMAAMVLLAVFGMVQLQVLPALTAAAARADGDHGVEVGAAGRNGVRVVLRHHQGSRTAVHAHHGLIRLVAGSPQGAPHPDHELVFSAGSSADEWKPDPGGSVVTAAAAEALVIESLIPARKPRCPEAGRAAVRWWPPTPQDSAWGRTVLLI